MASGSSGTRVRVLSDNDYAGDPDGLLQLAHQALSTSAELVAVIGSHLPRNPSFDPRCDSADRAADEASTVLDLAGAEAVPVLAGSNVPLAARNTPIDTPAVRYIIDAAMASDDRPLFACFGGGLTELASAWLLEPRIAGRFTAIWIGGAEHPGLADPPPGAGTAEFNASIDPIAAQVVLNDSDLDVWQVPRDAYRQVLVGMADLEDNLAEQGPLGDHLLSRIESGEDFVRSHGLTPGEVMVLGDSPLVSLSTLQTTFEPSPASSRWVQRPAPLIASDGNYAGEDPRGRTVRVFTHIDTALIVRDLFAKVSRLARRASAGESGR